MPLRRVGRTARAGFGQAAALLRRRSRDGVGPLSPKDVERLADQITACLDPRRSATSAAARAAELVALVDALDDEGLLAFFELLTVRFGPDRAAVDEAVGRWSADLAGVSTDGPAGAVALARAVRRLRHRLISPRFRLFELLCGLDGGVKFAVDLRAELLRLRRAHAELSALDGDLREVLARLFPPGLLELRRITWDSAGSLLEKIIEYEAVHEITSWDDLKHRLDGEDRRCYAFLHPGMPDEPLIFVEVALVTEMASAIGPLLDADIPRTAGGDVTTAVFYSISNCQPGLAGINLGDVLIKEVVADLLRDLPGLDRFVTLSPIPGFRAWLEAALAAREPLLEPADRSALAEVTPDGANDTDALAALLADDRWTTDRAVTEVVRPVLLRACAHYLVVPTAQGRARDRVANFHLTNGARVERINWLANPTPAGMRESLGLMVNYRYDLPRIDSNHEAYVSDGRIARSSSVSRLIGRGQNAQRAHSNPVE
jgi:malonyl-CoA decarboxylase